MAPLEPGYSSRFLATMLALGKPVLVSEASSAPSTDGHAHLIQVNFDRPEAVGRSLQTILESCRPASQSLQLRQLLQSTQMQQPAPQTAAPRRPFPASLPTDLVLFNDWGIGDELLLSAVGRELKTAHPGLKVWIRSRYGFRYPDFIEKSEPSRTAIRVETIYQNAVLYGPKHHAPFPGHLVQQMLDKVALDTGIKVTAKNLRPELILTPGIERQRDLVLLHCRPNPRLPSKDWGLPRWEALSSLLTGSGYRVLQVGGKQDPPLPGAQDARGTPLAELPPLFQQAGLVICLVGMLMHMAAATETPALVIFGGREHPAIDGYPGHLHLCSEPLDCRGRWGCHLDPDTHCPHGMQCMEAITPDLVAWLTKRTLPLPVEAVS
ncbi:MAG: glycosyltransferase family 9 protein [Planctomycetota bacterium]